MSAPRSTEAQASALFGALEAVVWELVRWENADALVQGGLLARVEYAEQRALPGAERSLIAADGSRVRERLKSLDSLAHGYTYQIVELGALPLERYVGHVALATDDKRRTRLTMHCRFIAKAVSDAAFIASWTAQQEALFAFVRAWAGS